MKFPDLSEIDRHYAYINEQVSSLRKTQTELTTAKFKILEEFFSGLSLAVWDTLSADDRAKTIAMAVEHLFTTNGAYKFLDQHLLGIGLPSDPKLVRSIVRGGR